MFLKNCLHDHFQTIAEEYMHAMGVGKDMIFVQGIEQNPAMQQFYQKLAYMCHD